MSYPAGTILDASGNPLVSSEVVFEPDIAGASFGEHLGDWGLSTSSPSVVVTGSLGAIRKRSREGERNNSVLKGAIDLKVSNLVGNS